MDLVSGLAAASQTLTIVKQMRELDGALNQAAMKSKLLELQEAACEAKAALLDAKEACLKKDEQILELNAKLKAATSGDNCPVCDQGTLKVKRVIDHPTFGEVGVQEKHLECDSPHCRHIEKRMHDPMKVIEK